MEFEIAIAITSVAGGALVHGGTLVGVHWWGCIGGVHWCMGVHWWGCIGGGGVQGVQGGAWGTARRSPHCTVY